MDNTTIIFIGLVAIIGLIGLFFLGKEDESEISKELRRLKFLPTTTSTLIEYDKLLDHYLKNRKVSGETLGERLKNARGLFGKSDYNQIWEAHKLRNRVVHEVGINIDKKELELHISNFRRILSSKV